MDVNKFQQWLKEFSEENGWSHIDIFLLIGLLAENLGTMSYALQVIRMEKDQPFPSSLVYQENRKLLIEGLGDMLGNITFMASHYDIELEDVLVNHQKRLARMYATCTN